MNSKWTFVCPTKLISGAGCLGTIGQEVLRNGFKRAMIVTDPVIAKSPMLDTILQSLNAENIDSIVFSQVEPEPTVENVENAVEVLKAHNCECLIALGGGSAMDAAKGAAVLATNTPPIQQYEGADKVPVTPMPLFAVPTTAGTGSEVSQSAVLRDGNAKRSVRSVGLIPRAAFLDPVVVSTVPYGVAVNCALDALAHNLEAYLSRWASPMTEMVNELGLRLIGENLLAYCANPGNLEAAANMQLAAMLGAAGFGNARVGLPHTMGMALGGVAHIPHGLACGISMPVCVKYSWPGNPAKYRRIAELLGVKVEGLNDMEMGQALVKYLYDLIRMLDKDVALSAYGVTDDQAEAIAADMFRQGMHVTDPREITLEGTTALVREAIHFAV